MNCRRCGTGFRPELKYEAGALIQGVPKEVQGESFEQTDKIHICQNCYKALKKWVTEYKRPPSVFK